jgi:hypothetical protein
MRAHNSENKQVNDAINKLKYNKVSLQVSMQHLDLDFSRTSQN